MLQTAPPLRLPFRKVVRSPGRHGSVRATKEAALEALAETKARVSQAMEDTVAIRSSESMDEVARASVPRPSRPQPQSIVPKDLLPARFGRSGTLSTAQMR